MIRSMTAFARREATGEWGALVWELRSVNHRYLETAVRLPEELRALEPPIRERAQAALGRGKLDATLRYQPAETDIDEIIVNETLVKALLEACARIESHIRNPARMAGMDMLRWPGAIRQPEQDLAKLGSAALIAFDQALAELVTVREREGQKLKELLLKRREAMLELVAKVRARRPQVLDALREKVTSRINQLQAEPDSNRLEQELVYLAQKLDVDEELDRLDSHLEELPHILARDEPAGRRLDFLLQEFNREANTLGSKSGDVETTQAAMALKVLIEQMREQVQNVE